MSSTTETVVFVGTFNVDATPPNPQDLAHWFTKDGVKQDDVDIFAFGFQEMVHFEKGQDPLAGDPANAQLWVTALEKSINSQRTDKVVLVKEITYSSVYMCVFARESLATSNILSTTYKLHTGTMTGYKGAMSVRFESFSFISAHFQAYHELVDERIGDYKRTVAELVFETPASNGQVLASAHDVVFWFGDLNFRIDLPKDEVEKLITEKKFDYLLENCQSGEIFVDWIEAPITFPPTYKFQNGVDVYDISEKQRVPAWTDRVFHKSTRSVEQLNYFNVQDMRESDHRPVGAFFKVK